MSGAAPVTVMDSCRVATVNPIVRRVSDPTAMVTFWRNVLNPGSDATISYCAGGSSGSRNVPSASVVASRTNPVAGFVAVTVTPGSTPFVSSVTCPVMVPSTRPWATAIPGRSSNPTTTPTMPSDASLLLMCPPPSECRLP